jgi:predicted nucleic acid-binding protein
MILVDSSVWINHLRQPLPQLHTAIGQDLVLTHPYVVAELAMGHIPDRDEFLAALRDFPRAETAGLGDFLEFVDHNGLSGTGLGMVDGHLLASAAAADVKIWSADKLLSAHARRLGLSYET